MTLLYNVVMVAVDVAAIRLLCRYRGLLAWCVMVGCAGLVALVLGGVLAGRFENRFGVMRLWIYGALLHGPAMLAASAVLWRRCRPWLACAAALVALAVLAIAADALLIEPHWLEVSHWRIASPKIRRPVRIVVVADLQTDCIGSYERRVLRQVLEEKPDIILLAGDYFQAPSKRQPALRRELNDFLREIGFAAPRGVFALQGNIDSSGWHEMFAGLGVTCVIASQSFDLYDVQLTCLGLYDSFNWSLVVTDESPKRFHLVAGHVPNFAMGKIGADLLVAGHTHGGQVRLPWVGAIITNCHIPRGWAAGLTELPGGGKLLVSRGVGMERSYAPRIRFLCRPELMVIDLVPEEKGTTDEP